MSSREHAGAVGWVAVVLVTISGALAAWLESLLVPYYVGGTVLPVAVLFALASNWFLPRLARSIVPSTLVSALPFVAWLSVVLFVSAAGRPEGDVILPGGGGAVEYVGYGFMLAGALAGTLSVVMSTSAGPAGSGSRGARRTRAARTR